MDEQTTTREKKYWWKTGDEKTVCERRQRPGEICPSCGLGRLAYDGLFILRCAECDYVAESGAFS